LIQIGITASAESTERTDYTFGYGEVGLPPKKKACYLADYNDVLLLMKDFASLLARCSDVSTMEGDLQERPFTRLGPRFFGPCRKPQREAGQAAWVESGEWRRALLVFLLDELDTPELRKSEAYNATKCGVEMAVFDYWGKMDKVPVSYLLGLDNSNDVFRKGYYTAAINLDVSHTVDVIRREASAITRFLKIKVGCVKRTLC
jgi:hypothetical protein